MHKFMTGPCCVCMHVSAIRDVPLRALELVCWTPTHLRAHTPQLERRHAEFRQRMRQMERALQEATQRAHAAEKAREECAQVLRQVVQENYALKRQCWEMEAAAASLPGKRRHLEVVEKKGQGVVPVGEDTLEEEEEEEDEEEEEEVVQGELDLREEVFGMLQRMHGDGAVGISQRAVGLVDGMLRGVLHSVLQRAVASNGGTSEGGGTRELTGEQVLQSLREILPSAHGVERVQQRALEILRCGAQGGGSQGEDHAGSEGHFPDEDDEDEEEEEAEEEEG